MSRRAALPTSLPISRRRALGGSALLLLVPQPFLLACSSEARTEDRATPRDSVNVMAPAFGAKGDGKTDDSGSIQRAILAAERARGSVFFPAVGSAFYRVSKPLKISSPVRLIGEATFGVTLCGVGLKKEDFVIDIDGEANPNLEWVEVERMTLMSDNRLPSLIRLNRAANCAFRDIGLRDAQHGILLTSDRCYTNLFERVIDVTGLTGSTVRFEGFTGGGQFTFIGCSFGGNVGVSLTADSVASSLAFLNCNFERCRTNAFAASGSVRGLLFSGCRTEKGAGAFSFDINPGPGHVAYGIEVSGCFFETDAERAAISFGGSGGPVRGFSIRGNYAEGYTENFVRLNGEGESGTISGNFIDRDLKSIVNVPRRNVDVVGNEHSVGKYPNMRSR